MEIAIFGSGYVGLVTGACFAEVGNQVTCIDINSERVEQLQRGIIPIFEPGLESLIHRNQKAGRLHFSTDAAQAIQSSEVIFIAVGTPPDEDGSADLRHVLSVAQTIGENMTDYHVVVTKSTVPVGTADKVRDAIGIALSERQATIAFDVASNPEFLKEGAAISDFMKPDRIVIGTDSGRAESTLRALYMPFNRNRDRLMVMDIRSAELTKYAANAMLATKISFMNELSNIAERVGADIEEVRVGIGADPRIGYHFIYPGCGYGGSCFPKDVRALAHTAKLHGYDAAILDSVEQVNRRQKDVLFKKIHAHFNGDLASRTFALWGLSFKPGTDDMREAPSRTLMESLWSAGANVRAYDPEAMEETRHIYGERSDLTLCESANDALAGADALVLLTEWIEFRSPDIRKIKTQLKDPVIFDGRNIYEPDFMRNHAVTYYSIGRPIVDSNH